MMTRAQLKRFIAECVILLLVSSVLIVAGYMVSSTKSDIRVQISLVERFSPVLKASSFAPTGGAVLADYPEINSVYIGYDSNGDPIGYVIDMTSVADDGTKLHLLIGFEYENAKITGITRVGDSDDTYQMNPNAFTSITNKLTGAQVPIAFISEDDTEDISSEEANPATGLKDGTYYAQMLTDDKNGYIDYVEMEIEDGVITKVKWDAFNIDPTTEVRSQASLSGAYEIPGIDWATQSYNICHALLLTQDPEALAMKSDGTTEIVDGVTCNIRAFVELSLECIENSKAGFDKNDYMEALSALYKNCTGYAPEDTGVINKDGFLVYSFEKYPEKYCIMTDGDDPEIIEVLSVLEITQMMPDEVVDDDEPEETEDTDQTGITEETMAETTAETEVTEATEVTEETIPGSTNPNGAEDGIVPGSGADKQILTDSIDDLPLSEIETYIIPDDQYYGDTRLMVHMCNTCYKFFKDYLNWLV
ncbi:MAG: hypothetical protein IK128_00970 [Clostridiales bacterium]|nr:hypothetical protein [Clostridiales bacterium]